MIRNSIEYGISSPGIIQIVQRTGDYDGLRSKVGLSGDYAPTALAIAIEDRPGVVQYVKDAKAQW